MVPRALSELQKNVTAAVSSIGSEVSGLHDRVAEVEAVSGGPRMCPMGDVMISAEEGTPQEASSFAIARLPPYNGLQIVGRPHSSMERSAEMDAVVAELAALRGAVERAYRREFALVRLPPTPASGIPSYI